MKWKVTIVLLALLAAAGAFYILRVLTQPSQTQYEARRDRVFPTAEFENPLTSENPGLANIITNIEIQNESGKVALVRQDSASGSMWMIVEPKRVPGDMRAVRSLLTELELLTIARTLDSKPGAPLNPAEYGLEHPARHIIFGFAGRSWTLDLGSLTADGIRLYVARPDKPGEVYVVLKDILALTEGSVGEFRDKEVLGCPPEIVQRIVISHSNGQELVLKKDNLVWRIVSPVSDLADPEAVRRLLTAAQALRIEPGDFIAEPPPPIAPAQYGLDKPDLRIMVFVEQGYRSATIGSAIADKPGKLYAQRSLDDAVFALDEKLAAPLRISLNDLRSSNVLSFDPRLADEMNIRVGDDRIVLNYSDDGWIFDDDGAIIPDQDRVKLALSELANLKIESWIDSPSAELLSQAGLESPNITVSVQAGVKEAAGTSVVSFGAEKADRQEWTYARRESDGAVMLVSSDLPRKLAAGRRAFLSRKLLEFAPIRLVEAQIIKPDGKTMIKKDGDSWTVNEKPADQGAINDLLWYLSWLEGVDLIADGPSDLAQYGLDKPQIKVVIQLAPAGDVPAEQRTVLIGSSLSNGNAYAMIEGEKLVVTVSRAFMDRLTRNLAKAEEK